MALAIKADNISKAYQIGEFSTGTITSDLHRWWTLKRGKEDPYLKIGETNDRSVKGESNIVWSLKDVNFKINEGDAVGIIGRNGAGKSTILKILSKVTSPTNGGIKIKGRIASLLEVGTGFHPELTGRENIFLNGAILGMRKKEITRKFDEIVDFSGIQRYIDTPVKRYSSGMYVRLAFAVAAHLESEILIVDEVLAVGDVEFQKKCLGKMDEVSKGEGRTILFVSHNMNAIAQLCNKGIFLKNGMVQTEAPIRTCIKEYLSHDKAIQSTEWSNTNAEFKNRHFHVQSIKLTDHQLKVIPTPFVERSTELYLLIEGIVKEADNLLKVGYELFDDDQNILFTSLSTDDVPGKWPVLSTGLNRLKVAVPTRVLKSGKYKISIHVSLHLQQWIINSEKQELTIGFELLDAEEQSPYLISNGALFSIQNNFEVIS